MVASEDVELGLLDIDGLHLCARSPLEGNPGPAMCTNIGCWLCPSYPQPTHQGIRQDSIQPQLVASISIVTVHIQWVCAARLLPNQ
eukprot:15815137-Heterocapsa_arctica.AAC.1